jgi:vancomycin resistance protein YoaR
LAIAVVIVSAALALVTRDRGRIYPNVFVAGRAVGGLTPTAAAGVLRDTSIAGPETPAQVRVADHTYRCKLQDLGVSFSIARGIGDAYAIGRTGPPARRLAERVAAHWRRTDIELPAVVDAMIATAFAQSCARRFDRAAVDARAEVEGGAVHVTSGQPGLKVVGEEVLEAVSAWARGSCRGELRMPARFTGPTVTADRLQGVDTVLATVSTTLAGSSRNRRHNVAFAAAAVDGHIVAPGEVFSYNQAVGPRTEETGYRTAPVIVHGKLVPGTGGGACQLSSTLYQAALWAGLEIVARSHHSHPVAYTKAGLDATVVYGAMDLQFRNSTQHPVVLAAHVRNGRLACALLGHGPAPRLELVREVGKIAPPEPQVIEDPDLAPGERKVEAAAVSGLRVRVLRRSREAGASGAQVISTDYYAPRREVVRVSVPSTGGQAPAEAAYEGTDGEVAAGAPGAVRAGPGEDSPAAAGLAAAPVSGGQKKPAR